MASVFLQLLHVGRGNQQRNCRSGARRGVDSQSSFGTFACELITQLQGCFKPHWIYQRRRELMWEHLFKMRSSAAFKAKWSDFLSKSINVDPWLIFYQSIVDSAFNALIKRHFQFDWSEDQSQEVSLDCEEKNTLRYTAGYITRALVRKLKRSVNH